jgi:hypothetical protein
VNPAASARVRERLDEQARVVRLGAVARWCVAGAILGLAAATIAASIAGPGLAVRLETALLPVAAAAVAGWWRARRLWSRAAVAEAFERRQPADNLVVTAEALERQPNHPWLPAVSAAAWSRLDAVPAGSARSAWMNLAVALLITVAAVTVPVPLRLAPGAAARPNHTAAPIGIHALSVTVTPPTYLGGDPVDHDEPTALEVLAGSQVAIHVSTTAPQVLMTRDGGPAIVTATSGGGMTATLPAPVDGAWLVSAGADTRLVRVRERDDRPPVVRIVTPGRDRRQPLPVADLAVRIEARDDHGLADLRLRFTTVSGAGESLTFADRERPVRVIDRTATAWQAEGVLPLGALELRDGDVVVYRGVATDGRPGASAVESDAFIVEIGAPRAASDAGGGGEDVDPDARQAISQQMVIVKTERLHARRGRLRPETLLDESQGLAIEQRMVRAEFVFMMGGEVQDEVEEAAHAHDVAEGRLENEGQAALLGATRAMSRAEARLADGDTAGALVAEREALGLLRRAFDRRRFLLRPVAERARLDPARRLQGATPPGPAPAQPVRAPESVEAWDAIQSAAQALAAARADGAADLVIVAARLSALEAGDPAVAAAADALTRAGTPEARGAALDAAQRALHAVVARRLAAAPAPTEAAVSGGVADALRRRRSR